MHEPRIVFLGTGTPNPDPERQGPSLAVIAGGQAYLVDAGVGVVRQAMKAHGMGVEELAIEKLTHLFLTHLHSDHTLGYPDLIFTPAVTGRKGPLNVWGPRGTRAMTQHIEAAWKEDYEVRSKGGEPMIPEAYEVLVSEIQPGVTHEDENFTIQAFRVTHGAWKEACGFKFTLGEKTIVISGDTTPCEELVKQAKGCDILVHEVCSDTGLRKRSPEWQAYHRAYHTTGKQLGELCAQIQPKLLLPYHVLLFGEREETLLKEIRDHYGGEVVIPKDLDMF